MRSHHIQRVSKGFKSKQPTQTYNLMVNHGREIWGTTSGHPGSFDDKSVVLFDDFVMDIKRGDILSDYELTAREMGNKLLQRRKWVFGLW